MFFHPFPIRHLFLVYAYESFYVRSTVPRFDQCALGTVRWEGGVFGHDAAEGDERTFGFAVPGEEENVESARFVSGSIRGNRGTDQVLLQYTQKMKLHWNTST